MRYLVLSLLILASSAQAGMECRTDARGVVVCTGTGSDAGTSTSCYRDARGVVVCN